MRSIKLLLLLMSLIYLTANQAKAQGMISGKVRGAGSKGIAGASVMLMNAKDTSLIKAEACNTEGKFEFDKISHGSYLLGISAIGYKTLMSPVIEVNSQQEKSVLDNLQLQAEEANTLKEVKLTTKKPFIEQKIDKTVVNLDASLTNTGSSVLEVLEKSPGVAVDKDGNVSLKGKQGVVIMIDGKPTYLHGNELANYLRNMPSSAVEQLEIMTNPPAKYDAAGNSGVINIRTKKNKAMGFNGSVTANYGQGRYWKANESINLNYRTKKFNFFGNYSYYRWSGYQNIYVKRNFFSPGTKNIETIFEQESNIKQKYPGHTLKAGVDYFLSQNTSFGLVLNGSLENGAEPGMNTSYIKNSAEQVNTIVVADNSHKQQYKNFGSNINFKHRFDSAGKEITADFDFLRYQMVTNQNFLNKFYTSNGQEQRQDEILKGHLPSGINIYSAKADYTHPLKKNAKFEAGLKVSFVKTDNDAQYSLFENNQWVVDSGRTNNFLYRENIFAGYVNYNRQIGKWGIQLGLRMEQTQAKGKQFVNDSSFTRNYSNLFPTGYISYAANDKNQFGLSFGRRIERPAYQDLNPFRYFLDPYTFQQGNPFLKPQFSYNVELSHTYRGALTTTLNYTRTVDMMAETLSQIDKDTIIYVSNENIASSQNLGIAISLSAPVNKWYTTNFYTNVYYSSYEGLLQGEPLHASGINANFNMNNQFNLGKGWSAEISGWARTKGIEGQFLVSAMGAVNSGVQKQVLKKQGSVKLSVDDIFDSRNFNATVKSNTIDVLIRQSRESRVIKMTFTYRFGKSTSTAQERRSSAEEEQNRVKH